MGARKAPIFVSGLFKNGKTMLQAIRDRVSGIVAGIILGLLAIPFALVGIQNYFTPDPGNVVATVG